MSRNPIWAVLALGGVISAVSGIGVVAVFSDTALTGANDVTSGQQPHLALQISNGLQYHGGMDCLGFVDELQTGLYTATDLQPGDVLESDICLKNTFTGSLSLAVRALDLVDLEDYCTNDESLYDSSCSNAKRGLPGELSPQLNVTLSRWTDCADWTAGSTVTVSWLPVLATTPESLGNLTAGEIACFQVFTKYTPSATYDQRQAAQSDQAIWRFAFDATED